MEGRFPITHRHCVVSDIIPIELFVMDKVGSLFCNLRVDRDKLGFLYFVNTCWNIRSKTMNFFSNDI